MSDNNSVAFVRTESLPELPPPPGETGIIKWARENLFASIPSGILPLVSLYVIYQLVVFVGPWIINGIWNTNSLAECREALAGDTGACFSVISERWNQLLFGFSYPTEFYWRPGLAFILLFVAAAPVMFFDLPRKMLIFTGIYPFLA